MVKNRLATDVMQARTEGSIEFASDEHMNSVLSFVNSSIESSFNNGVDFVLGVAAEYDTTTQTTKAKKTTRSKKS